MLKSKAVEPKVEGKPRYGTNKVLGLGLAVMTIFSVLHKTIYRYKNPVQLGLHELLSRQLAALRKRLLDCRLKVTPAPAEVRWIHDVFGNCVTLVDFATKTPVLKFESVIRLEHQPENAPYF